MSNIRSEPLRGGPRSQVIPKRTVEQGAVVMLWAFAVLLWLISTFGNFVLFVGGWEFVYPMHAKTGSAVGYALLYQVLFTVAQWGFKAKRWWGLYIVALLASAIPSFLTYNSWASPWLVARVAPAAPADVATLLAGVFLFVVAVLVDLVPEWVLVE